MEKKQLFGEKIVQMEHLNVIDIAKHKLFNPAEAIFINKRLKTIHQTQGGNTQGVQQEATWWCETFFPNSSGFLSRPMWQLTPPYCDPLEN